MYALLALVLLVPPLLGGWLVAARHGAGVRVGFALALLAWNMWAVLLSELLSLGDGALRPWSVAIGWAIPSIAAMTLLIRRRVDVGVLVDHIRGAWREITRVERLGAVFVAVSGALIFVVGIVSAPNNWDSMSYHLTRVARWVDLHQVTHYATAIDPQLYQPPGAELGILQWYVLADGDRYAFVGQWLAWVGVVLLASRAAQLLGASRRAAMAASVVTAAIPMAILQASSTQNDLTLALWLALAVVLALRVGRAPRIDTRGDATALLLASAALGLAVLTKGTGALMGAPIGVLLLVVALRRFGALRGIALAVTGAVLLVIPNAGAWQRNINTFDSPFATGLHGDAYRVQHPTVGTIASNLIRNATNHMDLPGDWWNDRVERGAIRLNDAIGQDANDPATTFEQQPFRVGPYGPHEDHAGSLLLLLLAPIGIVLALARVLRRRLRTSDAAWQAGVLAVVMTQVLLFAALITWQNWHARLHLPMLVLLVPPLIALLDTRRWRWLLAFAVAVSVATAPIALFGNVNRPLVGDDSILTHSRTHVLFNPRPQLEQPYRAALERMDSTNVREAGIVSSVDEWQYPLIWLGLRADPPVHFVDVSTRLGDNLSLPTSIVCVSCTPEQVAQLEGVGYKRHPIAGDGSQPGRGNDTASVNLFERLATPS